MPLVDDDEYEDSQDDNDHSLNNSYSGVLAAFQRLPDPGILAPINRNRKDTVSEDKQTVHSTNPPRHG
jgi:hypothetical protein